MTEDKNHKWWTLTVVCAGIFMLLLDITIVIVALPQIERSFKATLTDLQWVIDAYALTLAALLLTAGSLADRLGTKKIFSIGIVIFTLGSLLCGISSGTGYLIAARAFQGVGGAIMFATSLALLASAFQGKDRGTAFGVFGAVSGVAVAVGPIIGGLITSAISWRWIFIINVPIGIATFVVTLLMVKKGTPHKSGRIDIAGFVTFSVALALLIYGFIESSSDGWGSRQVVFSLVGSGVLLVAFVILELVQKKPMFDLGLLRLPSFTGGLIAAFGVNGGLFALFTYIVLYMENVLVLTPVQAGERFLLLSCAMLVTASAAGRLTNMIPIKYLITPGFILCGIGLLFMHGITATSSWTHFIPGFIIAGAGGGFVNVPLASTAVGVVAPQRAGMASGINSTFRQVGTATGIAVLGSIFGTTITTKITSLLDQTAYLKPFASKIAKGISSDTASAAPKGVSPQLEAIVHHAAIVGVATALNDILFIGAIISFVAGVICFFLIRQKDFHVDASGHTAAAA